MKCRLLVTDDIPDWFAGVFMGCAVMVYLLYSLPSIMVANRIA